MLLAVQEYIAAQEIAQLLGVSRQRVQQLVNHKTFPDPALVFAMGKAWRTDEVKAWAEARGRTIRDED